MYNEIDHVVVDVIPEATSSIATVKMRMILLHGITTFGILTTADTLYTGTLQVYVNDIKKDKLLECYQMINTNTTVLDRTF